VIVAGSTALHFEQAGSADGSRVLLLVHGFPFNAAMWRPQLQEPPPGWRVIAPDLAGFGGNPPADQLSVDGAADDLAALLESLDVRSAVVCGLSMGGYIAFALLRRHPALVRALVLCDTRAAADTGDARRGRLESAASVRSQGTGEFLQSMLPKLLSPITRKRQPAVEEELRGIMEAAPAASVAAALEALAARPDSTPILRSIAVPTQIIVGSDDEITPVLDAQFMARGIPGAVLTVIPDAGHVSNLENPDAFNRALHGFLGLLP
jgi:3-oxoadipate enol-lactonase